MTTEIKVPALGESVSEATVAKWMKAPGDAVAVDEPLVELETDKVTVEIPSPVAGTSSPLIASISPSNMTPRVARGCSKSNGKAEKVAEKC